MDLSATGLNIAARNAGLPFKIQKAHISGRQYCALVANMDRSAYKSDEALEQGRVYPVVYSPSQSLGWTKAARQDAAGWIAAHALGTFLTQETAAMREL